jgi:hypothetical protein
MRVDITSKAVDALDCRTLLLHSMSQEVLVQRVACFSWSPDDFDAALMESSQFHRILTSFEVPSLCLPVNG